MNANFKYRIDHSENLITYYLENLVSKLNQPLHAVGEKNLYDEVVTQEMQAANIRWLREYVADSLDELSKIVRDHSNSKIVL